MIRNSVERITRIMIKGVWLCGMNDNLAAKQEGVMEQYVYILLSKFSVGTWQK